MDRRESIKSILISGVAGGLVLQGCNTDEEKTQLPDLKVEEPGGGYGRVPEELARDQALMDANFFNAYEMATITALCDIILPADENSGSAGDAGVPEFIEFIVKDMPYHQVPLRGGLMWMDHESNSRFSKRFVDCSETQQIQIIDDIAYPDQVKPQYAQGASFFSKMRDLTLTGFYTTRIGIDDLGYLGNTPNAWDGVPQEVLDKHGLTYDEEWISRCVNQENRTKEPVWDQLGNLIG